MAETIIYRRKTRRQVQAFLRAYVALCREHGLVLAPDQDYRLCPVVNGLCQRDPEWDRILKGTAGVDEERREPFDVEAWARE